MTFGVFNVCGVSSWWWLSLLPWLVAIMVAAALAAMVVITVPVNRYKFTMLMWVTGLDKVGCTAEKL